jgi:ATP-dependent Clp protease protease subunit
VQGQAADIEIAAKEILRKRDLLNDILKRHTDMTQEQIDSITDRDFYMTAEEAVDHGIIDKVLGPSEE